MERRRNVTQEKKKQILVVRKEEPRSRATCVASKLLATSRRMKWLAHRKQTLGWKHLDDQMSSSNPTEQEKRAFSYKILCIDRKRTKDITCGIMKEATTRDRAMCTSVFFAGCKTLQRTSQKRSSRALINRSFRARCIAQDPLEINQDEIIDV